MNSTFANLPEDESKFPISLWFRRLLADSLQRIELDGKLLRQASPPLRRAGFRADGSNLPWLIYDLQQKSEQRFTDWIAHVRTALGDIKTIRTVERPEDRSRYLIIEYDTGLEAPSWLVSDGTLRLLALTIIPYLEGISGLYLIEEPENGIHPRNIETITQSLRSAYDSQILLASHSTLVLNTVEVDDILCFTRDEDGATHIVNGREHPALRDWKGEVNFSTLFASGVMD